MSAVDHPLNEKGYRQAKALQMALAAAAADPAGDGPASAAEAAALHAMFNAGALASPSARALADRPRRAAAPAAGRRRAAARAEGERARRRTGGRDTIGTVCGDECGARALGKLTQLGRRRRRRSCRRSSRWRSDDGGRGAVVGDRRRERQQVSARVAEFIHQIEHSPHAAIIVVGHSHFPSAASAAPPGRRAPRPELDAKLREEVLPNCGVACCQFDFTRGPRMITDVRVLIAMPSPTGDFRLVMQRRQKQLAGPSSTSTPPRACRAPTAASHRS